MKDVILIFFIVLSVSFAISYIAVLHKLKRLSLTSAQLFLENIELNQQAESIKANQELTDNDIHKENFIKFLSDSRDWAFEYIEKVQLALNNFKEKIEPEIEYFDKYKEIPSNQKADYQLLEIISDAYKDLIKFLPSEKNKNV